MQQLARVGEDIAYAENLLRAGEVIAIPTETVYGLAGNALDENAVVKIFEIKNRPLFNPLIVHTYALEAIAGLVAPLTAPAKALADAFWPGPLTLLVPKREGLSDLLTAGHPSVAIRIPQHPMTLDLLKRLDFPLAAPSANPFGYISPTTSRHVQEQLGDLIPYILDGGPCTIGLESTIVSLLKGSKPQVLRLGGISLEDIEAVVGPVELIRNAGRPEAPGMLSSHYAPRTPLKILPDNFSWEYADTAHVAYLGYQTLSSRIPAERQVLLSPTGDLREAAKNLFLALHLLDKLAVKEIWAELLPEIGLGRAINDRLRRAAVK